MSCGRRRDAVKAREAELRIEGALGAVIGYGSLAAFLILTGLQIYRWFREGEWTHVGVVDGLRSTLSFLGVTDTAGGRAAALSHWLDAPIDWLGLHRVLEAVPASLALFAVSVLGNCIFIYSSDRLREMHRA
jgi:hypothetical protein